jgi:class 3 adenylate cyclase/TolB-like protein
MSEENINRKIAVIVVADVVGYSKHMEKDENSTLKAYSECEQILKPLLEQKQGMIFNTAGDSVLIEFSSAVNAVECAVDFQNKIEQRNQSSETTTKLEFRIGINMGDVVSREGNLLGDGVNIAARLEALSQPNGVCISKSIYDLVVPKTKMTFNDLGIQKVKQNEFHAYDVLLKPSQKRKLKSSKTSFNIPLIGLGSTLILILVVGFVYINNFSKQNVDTEELASGKVETDLRSVMIKPFVFLSKNDDLNYVGPGFTTFLSSSLSQYPRLNIVPESSVNYIISNNLSNEEIRSQYGVDYLVNATLQASGDKIRLSFGISNLGTGEVVTAEMYEFNEGDIFQYQDKIADLALEKMSILGKPFGSNNRISQNPEIYKKHIIAHGHYTSWTEDGHYKAVQMAEEMLAEEPQNYGLRQFYAWIIQQKVYLGISDDRVADLEKSLELASDNLRSHDKDWIDAIALAAGNEGLLGRYSEACARLPRMNKLLEEKNSNSGDIAMTAWINQNCEKYEKAASLYESVFEKNPHFPAWVRYYYVYTLLASNKLEEAAQFALENNKLRYSYWGTNEILQLCLVYIAHKKKDLKGAQNYYDDYLAMQNPLSLGYMQMDLAAARSKEFFDDFQNVLKIYGMQ